MEINPSDVTSAIRRRRTIKPLTKGGEPNYRDESIDDETLATILENANWAPTHGFTEPWRFHIFRGAGRQAFAEHLSSAYEKYTDPAKFRAQKKEKLYQNVMLAPCTLAICMKRHEGRIPAEEEVEAVACAVQNIHLTATAFGLGGFWSSSSIYEHPSTKELLGLGEDDRCLGLFFLGYPKNPWPEREPGPVADKLVWHDE